MAAGAGYKYLYDANGNREYRFVSADGELNAGDTDITKYTWDNRNRLTGVTHFDTYSHFQSGLSDQTVQYVYDYQNRLIHKTLDPDGSSSNAEAIHQTAFVYDGNEIIEQFEKDGTGNLSSVDLSHRYLYGPAVDQILADEAVSSLTTPGQVRWTLADNLNTVRDLAVYNFGTHITTIANHRVYEAFGTLTSQTNAAVDCLFGFTGKPLDKDTGLQYNINRWYDSIVVGWLCQDPIGFASGTTNLYCYCGNNPTNLTDPIGYMRINVGSNRPTYIPPEYYPAPPPDPYPGNDPGPAGNDSPYPAQIRPGGGDPIPGSRYPPNVPTKKPPPNNILPPPSNYPEPDPSPYPGNDPGPAGNDSPYPAQIRPGGGKPIPGSRYPPNVPCKK